MGEEYSRCCMEKKNKRTVPEIIYPVFTKTSPKRSFCMTENERFELVFAKTGSINSGTGRFNILYNLLLYRKADGMPVSWYETTWQPVQTVRAGFAF